jgi:hypothetical protein
MYEMMSAQRPYDRRRDMKNHEGNRVWSLIGAFGATRRWVGQGLGSSSSYLNQLDYGRAAFTGNVTAKFTAYSGASVEELFQIAEG